MMLEALVIYSCIKPAGCDKTTAAYYAVTPSLKELVVNSEKDIKKYIGAYTVDVFVPIVAATNSNYYFKINSNWSINKNNLRYTKEW